MKRERLTRAELTFLAASANAPPMSNNLPLASKLRRMADHLHPQTAEAVATPRE